MWIDHLSVGDKQLKELLYNSEVAIHPFIIGELACGNIKEREIILKLLSELPKVIIADNNEVLKLIERRHLFGKGIGWIDAHILTSALLTKVKIFTRDKQLLKIITEIGISM